MFVELKKDEIIEKVEFEISLDDNVLIDKNGNYTLKPDCQTGVLEFSLKTTNKQTHEN